MTRESMAERQVRLEEQIKAMVASLAVLTQQGHEAAESRRRGYEAAEAMRLEILGIKHRLDGLEKSVDGIRPTTAELERVRDRVMFAGRLGQMMWGVGKALLAAAAGAAGYWYAMTGRPPP
ncbi:MAG: hypothetical protein J0H34_22285 [Rhizobiales bacterium]|nr:hypothetical protein [Hyphomicrobiales bacterium]